MEKAERIRGIVHLIYPVALLYYVVPPDTYIGVPREFFVLGFLVAFFALEAYRLNSDFELFLVRDYERDRIGAYALGSFAIGLGLLFFPMPATVVATCGMAWIDPLCGMTKGKRLYPFVPLAAYFILAAVLFIAVGYGPLAAAVQAVIMAVVAIAVEKPNLHQIDDDFLMVFVPLVAFILFMWPVS